MVDALAALQEGAVPTNEQALAFLSRLLTTLPTPKNLTTAGRGLLSDLRSVLTSLEDIVSQRNCGEELQEFLWRTRGVAGQLGKEGIKIRWGGKEADAKSKTQKGEKKASSKVKAAGQAVKQDAMQGESVNCLYIVQKDDCQMIERFPPFSYSWTSYTNPDQACSCSARVTSHYSRSRIYVCRSGRQIHWNFHRRGKDTIGSSQECHGYFSKCSHESIEFSSCTKIGIR